MDLSNPIAATYLLRVIVFLAATYVSFGVRTYAQLIGVGVAETPATVADLSRSSLHADKAFGLPAASEAPGTVEQFTAVLTREERATLDEQAWSLVVTYQLNGCSGGTTDDCTAVLTIARDPGNSVEDAQAKKVLRRGGGETMGTVRSVIYRSPGVPGGEMFITTAAQATQYLPQGVTLRLERRMRRTLPNQLSAPRLTGADADPGTTLTPRWNYVPGAAQYELQYGFMDDRVRPRLHFYQDGTAISPEEYDYIFREYGVSVETPFHSYELATTYPAGIIAYRVRAIFERELASGETIMVPGSWSPGSHYRVIEPYEGDLNWGMTRTFAEEGKSKTVVNYYDDALRSRQTQTNLAAEGVTIVGTNHYDLEGRQAASVLPVPAGAGTDEAGHANDLRFKPGFNRDNTVERNPFGPRSFVVQEGEPAGFPPR